jgi:hypothetical protein
MKLKWTLPVLLVTLTAAAQIPVSHGSVHASDGNEHDKHG